MKSNLDILKEVTVELDRFKKKLAYAIREQGVEGVYTSRHFASCKRAAYDLKNELTKLTQSSKYKYQS